jgi:hypothetical protein
MSFLPWYVILGWSPLYASAAKIKLAAVLYCKLVGCAHLKLRRNHTGNHIA